MITVTDLFAGAGGSSTGMVHVPGVEIRIAANHWQLAVDVHNANALIMRNNTARGDEGQMSTPAAEPMRTLTTAGHQSLVTPGDVEAARAMVDDVEFRMFTPAEVAAGMAFPADYLWDGSNRDRVKMAGNAVTPPSSRDLITCVAEALQGAA